jgi:large subunit ribosomal protein L28
MRTVTVMALCYRFPDLKKVTLYSEVIDKHLLLTVTERTMRLIDDCFGFDFYLLRTPDVDINSQLGMKLKRIILISLAKAVTIRILCFFYD